VLFSIQFPFADSRAFLDEETGLLSRPTWPVPSADCEFVRFFGTIRSRKNGGLKGWVGENQVCEAERALRFCRVPTFVDLESGLRVPIQVVFRRFFSEGLALGKFEVGIGTRYDDSVTLTREQTRSLIQHFLSLPVEIPGLSGEVVSCELGEAHKHLARLYVASSTSTSQINLIGSKNWWVKPGLPLLFLQFKAGEHISTPFWGKLVNLKNDFFPWQRPHLWDKTQLSCHRVPYKGAEMRLWVMGVSSSYYPSGARALRLYLLRLHAEQQCLKLILQNIAAGNIVVSPRTRASDMLQYYLNEATKRLARFESKSSHIADEELVEIARESEDFISPGERDALLAYLKNIAIRKNVFSKVEKYTNERIHINTAEEVIFMSGDNYGNSEVYRSKYDQRGANLGSNVDTARDNARVQSIQHNYNYAPEQKQTLAEAATEIQTLLKQLQSEGFSLDDAQKQAASDLVNRARNNPTFKSRLESWTRYLGDAAANGLIGEAVVTVFKLVLQSQGIPLP
jgi:hypothetical protein